MLAGRRQSSLDEAGGRRRFRRQASETRAPPPILAWQESLSEQSDKQKQVEVVAKKIGQPKPVAPARPLRSPSLKNSEACLTLSRRQVAERLRVGWSKANAKEGQDKGRQNLNIFLNKSFEVRPASPKTPELGNGNYMRSQSFLESRQDEGGSASETTSDSDSSDEEEAEAEVIEESKGQPPPNTSPGPRQTPPPPVPRPAFTSPSPAPRSAQPSPRPPLSASARRAAFRAVGRQRPTTSSPEPARPRLMSAPPQARHQPPPDRPTSAPPRRSRRQTKPRRGVEGGEVVTMVSLVSPAESEDEEPPPISVQCPPTPEVPPTPEPPEHTPPPPILSLRRPPKAVTFKSCSVDGPEYRTSYPARATTILHEEPPSSKTPEPPKPKPPPAPPQPPAKTVRTQRARAQPARESKKLQPSKIPEPIQEEGSIEVVEKPAVVEEKEKNPPEEKKEADEVPGGAEVEGQDPDFKSAKERECWQLFKRMSSRGVSVSFETVLRGLLTPTEYRLRRSALLASC